MILGLRTVVYSVPDLAAGKAWYSKVLEKGPYFDEPFYVGFEVGGFELGLIPDGKTSVDGPLAYWGVADAASEQKRLEQLGAKVIESVHEVGGGIYVASVSDPFGNSFGIIQNPHFSREKVR
jgi:predicted enzyme related to lactoylglutathione lyase